MVIFYKKRKKYNEFQLTKNKMDLNIRKMTNHPPSPVQLFKIQLHLLLLLIYNIIIIILFQLFLLS